MDLDERAKGIRAVCDCLRYVQADIDKANLPIVSLHVELAISEAETILDSLAPRGLNGGESRSA